MGLNTQGIFISIKEISDTEYLKIGCLQSLGDLDLGKRSSKEDGCMDKEVMGKVIGALKYGNLQIGYTYDPTESPGVQKLVAAHEAKQSPEMDFQIELPNKVADDGHGTQFQFKVYVTERSISFPKDDDMVASATLEMINKPTVVAAT